MVDGPRHDQRGKTSSREDRIDSVDRIDSTDTVNSVDSIYGT